MIAAGNAIAGLSYLYGGGHAGFKDTAYDCSGSISYAPASAGLVNSPMASGPFMTWGNPAPGVDHALRQPGTHVHGRRRLAL